MIDRTSDSRENHEVEDHRPIFYHAKVLWFSEGLTSIMLLFPRLLIWSGSPAKRCKKFVPVSLVCGGMKLMKNNHKVLAQFVSTFLRNNVSMFTKPIWSRFLHFGPLTWSMNLQVTTSWQMSTVGPAWWAMLPSMEHMMWGCSRAGRKALSHGLSRCYQDH